MTSEIDGRASDDPSSAALSRRQLLASTTVGIGATAGCLGILGTDSDDLRETPWTQKMHGPRNRSFAPHLGPGEDAAHEFAWAHPDVPDSSYASFRYSTSTSNGDRLFVHVEGDYFTEEGQTREIAALVALDRATREIDWQFDLGRVTGVPFCPTVADGVVTCPSGGALYGIDATNGSERWSSDAVPTRPPTASAGTLYVPTYGPLRAVSLEDGSDRWTASPAASEDDVETKFTPAVAGDAVYASVREELVALDRRTGEETWRTAHDAFESVAAVPGAPGLLHAPVAGDDLVFAGASVDMLYDHDVGGLVAFDRTDGTRRWQFDFEAAFDRSVPRAPSGESPWERREFDPTGIYGTPALADGTLYCGGQVVGAPKVIAIEAASGELRWEADVDRIPVHVLVGGNVAYVYRSGGVETYDRSDGTHLDTVSIDDLTFDSMGAGALTEERLLLPTTALYGVGG